jgi:hypothetical protein
MRTALLTMSHLALAGASNLSFLIATAAFGVIGSIFAVVAVTLALDVRKRSAHALRVLGKVIGYREENRRGRRMYFPEIEFLDQNGTRNTFVASIGTPRQRPPLGKRIGVIYSPNAIDGAMIDSLAERWAGTFLFGFLATAFLVAATLVCLNMFN